MRLSDENTREGRHLTPEERIALQAEEIKQLQQENEQLRAQVARMRELLTKAYDEIEKYKCLWKGSKPSGCDCPKPTALQDEIEQALAAIDKAIGGETERGKEDE